jgi:hypothetical protein
VAGLDDVDVDVDVFFFSSQGFLFLVPGWVTGFWSARAFGLICM